MKGLYFSVHRFWLGIVLLVYYTKEGFALRLVQSTKPNLSSIKTISSSLPPCSHSVSPTMNVNCRRHMFLHMSLTPLSTHQVQRIFPTSVTNEQWLSHWGVNKKERLQRILESVLISYGGGWLAWFLSFLAGGFVSGIVGTLLIFNWIYTPWLNANRRNYAFRSKGLYYGLFEAKIKR